MVFKMLSVLFCIVLVWGAVEGCSPAPPPPIKSYVERNNENFISQMDVKHFKDDGLKFIEEFCPFQATAAATFLNSTEKENQKNLLEMTTKAKLSLLKRKSELMFEVLLHDAQHRNILCEVAIIEHSGREKQGCQRQSAKKALERIMIINNDDNDVSIGGFLLRKTPGGNGGDEPPTPPPNKKPKLPDDAPPIIIIELDNDDNDNNDNNEKDSSSDIIITFDSGNKENVDVSNLEIPIPVSRTDSSTSCSSTSSVVEMQLVDRTSPIFHNRSTESTHFRSIARIHFPASRFGGRQVPRDDIEIGPVLFNPQTLLTNVHGLVSPTNDYINTCNVDSFLTHLILLSSCDPQLANKYFVTAEGNRLEEGLRQIINRYWQGVRAGESIQSISNAIIKLWLESARLPYVQPSSGDPVNLYGSEYQNVFEPLKASSLFVQSKVCKCNNGPWRISVRTALRNLFTSPKNISDLSGTGVIKVPLKLLCKDCKKKPRPGQRQSQEFDYNFVADTTWFLPFECPPNVFCQFTSQSMPVSVSFPDAFRPGQYVMFDLGYLAYSTHSAADNAAASGYHQVSFHRINNQWFFYDDNSNDGRLRQITEMKEFIERENLSFSSAVYFRRRIRGQPQP